MKFAAFIYKRRVALELTLEDLAEAAGMSKSHVWNLEQGNVADPSIYTCIKIGVALNLPINLMACAILSDKEAV